MAEESSPQADAPEAESTLSVKALALQQVVQEVLEDLQPQPDTCFDIPQITIGPENILQAVQRLKGDPRLSFKLLLCLAGVDYVEYLQVVYVLLSLEHEHKLMIKTNVTYEDPNLPSVSSVWRAADWYEREVHDLLGVEFTDHPGLAPLILYEGFEGYPGRKDHPFHDYQEF